MKLVKIKNGYLLNESIEGCKINKQNCDELFGVVDIDKLVPESTKNVKKDDHDFYLIENYEHFFKEGFDKCAELNKDKVFTIEDMKQALITMQVSHNVIRTTQDREELIQSFLNPTEIEVEFVMVSNIGLNGKTDGTLISKTNEQSEYLLKRK